MRTATSTPRVDKTWQLAISFDYVYQHSNNPGLYCHVSYVAWHLHCVYCIAHRAKDVDTMASWPNEFSPELHFEPPLTG